MAREHCGSKSVTHLYPPRTTKKAHLAAGFFRGDPSSKRQDFVKAVTQTGGIQAQVMSAAELALWARTDGLLVQNVKSALWQDRTLIKTWAMRCTLHLISASEFPLYVAARSTHQARNWEYYFSYYGITPAEYDAFIAAVPHILGSTPMTREQLATALAHSLG